MPEPLVIEENADPEKGFRTLRLKGPIVISNLFDHSEQGALQHGTCSDTGSDGCTLRRLGRGRGSSRSIRHASKSRPQSRIGGVSDRVRTTLAITQVESFFQFFGSVAAAEQAASSHRGVASQ